MSGPPYRIVRLDRTLKRPRFTCGKPELDGYFERQIGQEVDKGYATCFTVFDSAGTLVGYYTLSALSVDVSLAPEALRKKLPRYDQIPCALLGRLAVAADRKGQGIGSIMLVHALRTSADSDVASFAMVADAMDDEAHAFYVKHGFLGWDGERPLRCFLPLRGGSVPAAGPKPQDKAAGAAKSTSASKPAPRLPKPAPDAEPEIDEAPTAPRPALKRIR